MAKPDERVKKEDEEKRWAREEKREEKRREDPSVDKVKTRSITQY
jgi:hypothetical protein